MSSEAEKVGSTVSLASCTRDSGRLRHVLRLTAVRHALCICVHRDAGMVSYGVPLVTKVFTCLYSVLAERLVWHWSGSIGCVLTPYCFTLLTPYCFTFIVTFFTVPVYVLDMVLEYVPYEAQ